MFATSLTRCSQLSTSSNARFCFRWRNSVSSAGSSDDWTAPSVSAIVPATSPAPPTGADFYEPDAVGPAVNLPRGDFERCTRLANPPRAHQRNESCLGK